jgi:hypothetical protein
VDQGDLKFAQGDGFNLHGMLLCVTAQLRALCQGTQPAQSVRSLGLLSAL